MEKIKDDIINCITNFKINFKREYKEDNFFSYDSNLSHFAGVDELEKIWEIKPVETIKVKDINQRYLVDINNKIYEYYKKLLEKYNYSTPPENREEFNDMISKIFLLLCNIYDFFPNFLEIYFKKEWLNLHIKLIDACLDINNPPNPTLGINGIEKLNKLWSFLIFFSLCLSKDTNFNNRLYLVIKYPDLFYKLAITASINCCFCCCGHGMHYSDRYTNSGIYTIFLVFETFSYMEKNNIIFDESKKVKMQILEYLFKNIGKNPAVIFLIKMGKMLNTDEIFTHLLITTNLFKEALNKENNDCFSHAIDAFEAFISLCKNPDILFDMLNIISPPKYGLKNRIYREILKTISNIIINNNSVEYLEQKLYNNDKFQKILETLKQDSYLGDYEGIWQILLDCNNSSVVTIFYRNQNNYNIGDIMKNQIDNLIIKQLTGIRLNGVVRLMNLFLKMGNEIKKKYNVDNYYVEEFRDNYKKINDLEIKNDEDIDEFKKYYELN